jgi:hypothetical protein
MPRLLLPVVLLLGSACACPPLDERYDSPMATLQTWQAHLCRDDAPGEYGCLAASFKRAMGGFENYHAGRAALLADQPLTAWLFMRADLEDQLVEQDFGADGRTAVLRLAARGETVSVIFEEEAWVTVTYADGSRESVRQPSDLSGLLGRQGDRQWAEYRLPSLTAERLGQVRSLFFESRWLIADLAGLADPAALASTASSTLPSHKVIP